MGVDFVSWEWILFHGSGFCFMGADSVSWERILFHGSGFCFMNLYHWGGIFFMEKDLISWGGKKYRYQRGRRINHIIVQSVVA